jgi:hypothetical protein
MLGVFTLIGLSILTFMVGYSIGRIGHVKLGSKIDFLHHWIYGLILVLVGVLMDFDSKAWSYVLVFSGIGVFISDFYDFLDFRIWGADPPAPKKYFFGFD